MSVFNRDDADVARGAPALIALPDLGSASRRDTEARLEEAAGLAEAIGIDVKEKRAFKIRAPRPKTLFGQGQVDAIAEAMRESEAELLIVDGTVSPIQQKNLEDAVKGKVIDRTGLILEIFGERAATAEGRLQVELAHLDYQAGRLVRSWTHLERQRGGFGFLGGPGETQIEADRRLIRDRMAKLRRELEQVTRTRSLHRSRRQKAPWPVIALVGYTNAGKSTLFNRLTRAEVFAENLLFATLDPTMREISLPGLPKAILSDTVGFISDLPTQLVAAFRATLEEVLAADIIVHVRDISHPDSDAQREDVEQVLKELGVLHDGEGGEGAEGAAPMIEAWNKIDLLDGDDGPDVPTDVLSERAAILAEAERREDVVVLSALSGEGVDDLLTCVAAHLRKDSRLQEVTLGAGDGEAIAWLHQHGEVLHQESEGLETRLIVRIAPAEWERFQARR
ncbi:MAG: GTPase HflX [Allosphingosinicella sp.]|uniref:GTPase HflX n=1 Tax=Allosphingosinicella sp. TaxID=2823234 RepID=UPI00395F711B